MLVMRRPEKEKRKEEAEKNIPINNGCKCSIFDEKHYLHIQEFQQTPSRIKKKSTDTS